MKDFFKLFIFNLIFYSFFITFSAFGIPFLALIIAFQAPFISHRKAMKKFRRAIAWYGIGVCRILPFPFVRISYKDYETSINHPGPFIFICNHRSASDPFLMAYLPYDEVIQAVNIWPFKIPVLGFAAKCAGYLSVREMAFEDFVKKTIGYLNDGISIAAFPEGTRSADGSVGQFHSSIFRVALKSGYPIVPICITGNENIPARGTLLLKPGVIKIHKLHSITYDKYKDFSPYKLKNQIRSIMIDHIKIMESKRDA